MNTASELRKITNLIASRKEYLRQIYGVEKIGIFGSFARAEAEINSDLDILIGLREPISYFKFFDLEKEIASLVGKKIDLVTDQGIKSVIKARIMKDLIEV